VNVVVFFEVSRLIPKAHQWPNFGHCCFGHVVVIRRCDMIFWEFYHKKGIRRAFHLRAVWVVKKTSSNIFLENKRKLYHVK
jgi:hypothetical protein